MIKSHDLSLGQIEIFHDGNRLYTTEQAIEILNLGAHNGRVPNIVKGLKKVETVTGNQYRVPGIGATLFDKGAVDSIRERIGARGHRLLPRRPKKSA